MKDDIDSLADKVDALTVKVDALTTSMAVLTGRFQGGWWVVASLGSIAVAVSGWLVSMHAHIRIDQ